MPATQTPSIRHYPGVRPDTFGGNTVSFGLRRERQYPKRRHDDTPTTALNQLVGEYNTAAGKAWELRLRPRRNILLETEYDYADGQTSNPVTVSYAYGDAVWRDLLLPTTAKR